MSSNSLAASCGFKCNKAGGFYTLGKQFSKEKWLEIAKVFDKYVEENGGKEPSEGFDDEYEQSSNE